MEEPREKSDLVGDFREAMDEAEKGLGLSSKTETLSGEDASTVEVSDSGVCDVSGINVTNDESSVNEDGPRDDFVSDEKQVKAEVEDMVGSVRGEETKDDIEKTISFDDVDGDAETDEVKPVDEKEDSDLCNDVQEDIGEDMEIDYATEEQVEKDVKVGGALNGSHTESAGADRNDSNVVKEMEINKRKDSVDMAIDLARTIKSTDSEHANSPTEDAATGEVEPLDHALFDPGSDITNFIDFSGVSSWSGNIQDLKTETGNVCLKEDNKATDMGEEVSTLDGNVSLRAEEIHNESSEACIPLGAESAATERPTDSSDAIMGSVENPNNSDFADDDGMKVKADVRSEDSPGEGRKTDSSVKVSGAQKPSLKIGACIARAASQMAGSPSVAKCSNFGDETFSDNSFVSQLHCAAIEPVKENIVTDIATGSFLDSRNSLASQQVTPENVSSKRVKLSNSHASGTEAFEFEEMGDTYWTDRVIDNGGEEQTPPTDRGSYQIMPLELKPAQVQRTRRPYRRRQTQISIPHSASEKPANFDENAPAELIMNFFETDTIPPEKCLSKMLRHFGPIHESQTEVDTEKHRARVVFRKGADAEVAYNSGGRFNIFGTKSVKYELSYTITETFKVQPYIVSSGLEDAALCPPS